MTDADVHGPPVPFAAPIGQDLRMDSIPHAVAFEHAGVHVGASAVWSDVTLRVGGGEFVAILGPNGAGKTTMLNVILGGLRVTTGAVSVLGRAPGSVNTRIGYLPQRRSFDASTRIRGVDLVRLGLDGARWGVPLPLPRPLQGTRRREAAARVDEVIRLVAAEAYATRPIGRLSGGEQQRLLIAQALVREPELLLLDEPLDSLDLSNQGAVASLIQRVCRERGVAVLLVAHDVNPILSYLDGVVYLAAGRATSGAPADVITSDTLTRLYGAPIEVLRTSDGRLVVVGQPEAPFVHGHRHDH
jgi:zinc/manganese transport system ATP-binding protein